MSAEQQVRRKSSVLLQGIPHIPQVGSWDCGLACLLMSLRYLKPQLTDEDISGACKTHGLGESVWTIDLAFLCGILDIPHQFYTQTLGVDKKYANESFYIHNMNMNFTEEELRVNSLFERASQNGVNVKKRSISVENILAHIENGQPIIVLINDSLLRPSLGRDEVPATDNQNSCCLWNWFCFRCLNEDYSSMGEETSRQAGRQFWGHYVVIVGYNLNEKIFILNDPTAGGKQVTCSFTTLDDSRKSFGTDEDILFLFSPR